MMARPVVVLGANGRIGRLLKHLWPAGAIWLSRTEWDVLTPPPVLPFGAVILDLVGVTQGDFTLNPQLAESVGRAARAVGAQVIHVSSASVYQGGTQDMVEAAPLAPVSAYGASKREAEAALRNFCPDAIILRLGNVAGVDAVLAPRSPDLPIVLDQSSNGVRGPIRSYIGPHALAHALRSLCDTVSKDGALPPVMNLCQPGEVAMADLLDAADLVWSFGPARAGVVSRVVLSTKLQSEHLALPPATAASLVADLRALGGWP